MKRLFMIGAMAALLGGCTTASEVRSSSPVARQFQVPGNYETAYRRIKTYGQNCWENNFLGGGPRLSSDLFPQSKTATVDFGTTSIVGAATTYFAVEIRQSSDSATDVTIKRAGLMPSSYMDGIEKAALTGSETCR